MVYHYLIIIIVVIVLWNLSVILDVIIVKSIIDIVIYRCLQTRMIMLSVQIVKMLNYFWCLHHIFLSDLMHGYNLGITNDGGLGTHRGHVGGTTSLGSAHLMVYMGLFKSNWLNRRRLLLPQIVWTSISGTAGHLQLFGRFRR